jgi:hypothetical protein
MFTLDRKTKLLTTGNPKTQKSVEYGYFTAILHLSPYNVSGFGNVCSGASTGCKQSCLHTSGNPAYFKNKFDARNWRTWLFFNHRQIFYARLYNEIRKFEKRCARLHLKPAIRLNGTSDIKYPRQLFEYFKNIQFYDYSKIASNVKRSQDIENYDVTFSATENTKSKDIDALLAQNINVAIVFPYGKIPTKYHGHNVISGMNNDLRFLDDKGHIVGLYAIGKAKNDDTGFVKRDIKEPYLVVDC